MMAEGACKYLFFCLLFALTICSSGTTVGLSYDARKHNAISSLIQLKLSKVPPPQIRRVLTSDLQVLNSLSNSGVSVDLYLNETLLQDLRNYEPSAISSLRTHLMTFLPQVNIKSIVVSGSKENDLTLLLSTLKSVHSVLSSFHLEGQLKASVSFCLSFLENLNREQKRDLHRVLGFIKKIGSFVIVEATVDDELSFGDDQLAESMTKKASSAAEIIPPSAVSMVLKIKSSAVVSAVQVPKFMTEKILRSLAKTTPGTGEINGLFVEMSPHEEFQQKEVEREEKGIFHSSRRQLLDNFQHDTTYPPTIVTVTPNPTATPVTVPSTTPAVSVPPANPANSPVPIINPVTTPGATPVTNPVTTYPPPSTGVPVANPVPPATPGQSWCVAKSGAQQTALQAALDYACGNGADCSAIQQGASCYNPDTMQNHASYAFNSYYQKNPVQTSCDFGGTAMVTNANPSSGTCVYPSSSSSSSSSSPATPSTPSTPPTTSNTPPTTTTTPPPAATTTTPPPATTTTTPPTVTTAPPSGGAVSGSPPTVLNSSSPASGGTTGFGDSPPIIGDSPPSFNSTASMAKSLQPFIGCIILGTTVVTGKFILNIM